MTSKVTINSVGNYDGVMYVAVLDRSTGKAEVFGDSNHLDVIQGALQLSAVVRPSSGPTSTDTVRVTTDDYTISTLRTDAVVVAVMCKKGHKIIKSLSRSMRKLAQNVAKYAGTAAKEASV